MSFPSLKDPTVWKYLYTHERTEATTGYYTCLPEFSESLEKELIKLDSRPLDSFLHNKVLGEIRSLSPGELKDLTHQCLSIASSQFDNQYARARVLASLLLECAKLNKSFLDILDEDLKLLQKIASDGFSPFPYILKSIERDENEIFGDAIRELTSLPGGIGESRFKNSGLLENKKGLLRELYATFHYPETKKNRPSAKEVATLALERLDKEGLLVGPEMRHEASLSPIALLRQWRVKTRVLNGRHHHILEGVATAYGRGLSLAQARASCLMEIVERASAYVSIKRDERAEKIDGLARPYNMIYGTEADLKGERLFIPGWKENYQSFPLHWMEGRDALQEKVLSPVQSVFLFSNLDEASLYEQEGSTGLASGMSDAEAKLAALTEILERDANATTLFDYSQCFIPQSRNEMIQGLLDDYRAKGIFALMQDISNEFGFPVYRCVVRDGKGKARFATGAGLDGKRAAIAALTETPWPYSWANPFPSSLRSFPPPANTPVRFLEDLPNYSLNDPDADLALLEKLLIEQEKTPLYFDISRADLQFPVFRAFIPDMETNCEYSRFQSPGPRFFARNKRTFSRGK